jgi:uncharacterized protein (TIGR02996 family)
MTDEGFLEAILADPADEAVRLIYADWLEERGDPRGEFIRVQCELARLPYGSPRRPGLEKREWQLYRTRGADWRLVLPEWARKWSVFRRGFVEDVQVNAGAFLQGADVLFRSAPIRCAQLSAAAPLVAELAALPWLGQLVTLDLANNALGNGGARALAGSPRLARLQALYLGGNDIGDRGAEALAASPYLGGLQTLHLGGNPLGAAGRGALLTRFGAALRL